MNKYTLIIAFGDGQFQQTQIDAENSAMAITKYMSEFAIWNRFDRPIVSITVAEEIKPRE